ncbi:MAG TPA: choice-of-anchor D domain-containing protein, partial [Candidatus Acidoferrales bacterium]
MRTIRFLLLLTMLGGVTAFPDTLGAQNVSVSPTGLSFGTEPTQQVSAPRPILLTNNGTTSLQINSIVASAGFTQTNNCSPSVPSLGNCTINVTFSAGSTLGPISGSIAIFDSDPSSPQIVNLFGTAVVHMQVGGYNPQPIPFGFYQSTVVTNNLATPISVSPSTSGQFAQTNNCPNPLPPAGMCSVQLTFAPNAAGPLSGLLSVADTTEGSMFNWPLLGQTNGLEKPSLFYNPTGLYFWNQQVGTTSSAQFVLVTNQGSTPIQVNNVGIAGPFSLAGDSCTGTTLQPYISWCGLAVSYKPTVAGYNFGVASITSTDSASPQVVVLDGLALAEPSLNPNSLISTPQSVGTVGPVHSILLTNYQSVPLHISSITASAGYLQTNTCGATLGADSNCTISLTFAPQQTGPLDGSVTVVHDAPNSPSIANLYGVGLVPASMNVTQQENAKPGDTSWTITNSAKNHEIEGFASATSVNRGSTISFYVNTAAPSFTMDIYRMGWYGGA